MAPQTYWKLVAVLTVLGVCCIVGIYDILDNSQVDAAQRAQHECKSNTNNCDPNAYCYGNETSYECMCISGWNGDGFVGDSHSGCQKRQLSKTRLAMFIIAFILATLMILWFLVDALLDCIKLIAKIQSNPQVVLVQEAYPHHGIVHDPIEVV